MLLWYFCMLLKQVNPYFFFQEIFCRKTNQTNIVETSSNVIFVDFIRTSRYIFTQIYEIQRGVGQNLVCHLIRKL